MEKEKLEQTATRVETAARDGHEQAGAPVDHE
jgi:hypothetical protein